MGNLNVNQYTQVALFKRERGTIETHDAALVWIVSDIE